MRGHPAPRFAIGVPAAIAAVGYLIAGLHSLAGWLDPFRYLSGFYYAGQGTLTSGVDWGHLAVLAAASAVVLAAAVAVFQRRDLGGANRPRPGPARAYDRRPTHSAARR